MIKSLLSSLVRHLLTKGAGVLAAHGYLKGSDAEMWISAGVFAAGVGWSYFEKWLEGKGKKELLVQMEQLAGEVQKSNEQRPQNPS